mmetsp:Transcript_19183/g.55069  ORF Transcript_19183/g.55069 Transcript_19183/m.55069 type:complete len:95 (-) Transcript_19183:27-311(-)
MLWGSWDLPDMMLLIYYAATAVPAIQTRKKPDDCGVSKIFQLPYFDRHLLKITWTLQKPLGVAMLFVSTYQAPMHVTKPLGCFTCTILFLRRNH